MNTSILTQEFNPLKILHHFERLKNLAKREDIAPVTIEIDPVAYCNHRCAWCVDPHHHSAQMTESFFNNLISELTNFQVNNHKILGIVFKGGGEPTLHPVFEQMVTQTSNLGFAVGLVTNGSQLTKWANVLGERAAYVRVSIDGPTPASHKQIHGANDFATIVEGIKQLVTARGTKRHPLIGLTFTMDKNNVHLAAYAVALGENLGVDYILMRPPFFEEVGRPATMTIAEAQLVRKELRDCALRYKGKMQILVGNWSGDAEQQLQEQSKIVEGSGRRDLQIKSNIPIEHQTQRCLASPLLAVITADGFLYGCCNLRGLAEWNFGQLDYDRGITFYSLWHGAKRKEILKKMEQVQCLKHCTHPMCRYNEIIETLKDNDKFHSQFV